MRLFAFLALASIGCATRQPAEAPRPAVLRPLVVLVHGRGELGRDTAALRRNWKADIDSSLARVGLPALANDDVRLAWYADVLDPQSPAVCGAVGDSIVIGFRAFTSSLFATIAAAAPDTEMRVERDLLGDILYLIDPGKRCAAEQRVGSVIDAALASGRPTIVIAYSLGSFVAYDYLRTMPKTPGRSVDLVTLGSPLAIRVLRDIALEQADSIPTPLIVRRWVNVYNANDPFAGPLAPSANGRIEDRTTSESNGFEPHSVRAYLRDRSTGSAMAHAICDATRGEFARACGGLGSTR